MARPIPQSELDAIHRQQGQITLSPLLPYGLYVLAVAAWMSMLGDIQQGQITQTPLLPYGLYILAVAVWMSMLGEIHRQRQTTLTPQLRYGLVVPDDAAWTMMDFGDLYERFDPRRDHVEMNYVQQEVGNFEFFVVENHGEEEPGENGSHYSV